MWLTGRSTRRPRNTLSRGRDSGPLLYVIFACTVNRAYDGTVRIGLSCDIAGSLSMRGLFRRYARANGISRLRILLYSGVLQTSCHAKSTLTRCVSQMLSIYQDADAIGHFRESWQQLRQLTTCAHILILATAAGELHRKEATQTWTTLIRFLERLQSFWPSASRTIQALHKAALAFRMSPRQ